MHIVTRAELGWPPSEAPIQTTTLGVKVHYEGTAVSTALLTDHGACLREWKNIRASHLANTAEGYVDVAYNYAACPHGYLLEGRGIGRRTGANGNQDLNRAHYAIVGLVGSEGLTDPTPQMLSAIRDGIDLLQRNGAGPEIKGHRDGYATDCPGGQLYAWVRAGAPRPHEETDMTPDEIAGARIPAYGDDEKLNGQTASLGEYLGGLDLAARKTKSSFKALNAQVSALEAKVDALAAGGGLTAQQTVAAAAAGARMVLAELGALLKANQ